ncbi:MAG: lipocalin family protein [Prevotella sp.]|nr:lipocalin family protein [Prevotellaceae bacterium]MDY5125540.1 lipocalin family protein [Prevotella sp.]MDY6199054.1 lipocalin family protein [Prevotella sp.]
MKKYLFFLLTLVVASFTFVSCSDDDDDNQYNSAIVGTWKITEVKTSQSGSYIEWPFQTTYASFKSDGTYYGSGYFGTGSGTWSIKGNKVNTYVGGVLYASYEIISVTSTTSELKMSMGSDAIWIKCKKV